MILVSSSKLMQYISTINIHTCDLTTLTQSSAQPTSACTAFRTNDSGLILWNKSQSFSSMPSICDSNCSSSNIMFVHHQRIINHMIPLCVVYFLFLLLFATLNLIHLLA
eukprot:965644_1